MQTVQRTPSPTLRGISPSAPERAAHPAQEDVKITREQDRVWLDWTLSWDKVRNGPVEIYKHLKDPDVRVKLAVTDGPIIELLYESHEMPVPFDKLYVYVHSKALVGVRGATEERTDSGERVGKVELAGSSQPEGMKFSSPYLDIGARLGKDLLRFEVPFPPPP